MQTSGPAGPPGPGAGRAHPGQRIGDLDRAAATDALAGHFAAGRLSPDEFDRRAGEALQAVTRHDLDRLTFDLPGAVTGDRLLLPPGGWSVPGNLPRPAPTGWRGVDVLALLTAAGCLALGVLILLGLLVAGRAGFGVLGFLGGSVAALGGAAGYHTVRRALEIERDREPRPRS